MIKQVKPVGMLMGRLPKGGDLLEELNAFCGKENITAGEVRAIGAVERATLGFYNQDTREYEFHELDQALEIVALVGNVSLKDGEPFVHAHVTLGDNQGRLFGGHLAPGAPIFACEAVFTVFQTDAPFVRALDEPTGLPLWDMK
ncbi:MAG: DNA-binding protein [Desulfarculaceae bacterium]|nr:DNA-binding protein [Desulfarculaceae bacterium]MCF8072637.1 DNA-binding protein [Desulfarculaceae bacterium]MCF8102516.1 DNA-binding protein [Desulfarculaceae bacterium]MCF8117981.1 DNA-binding protein [Desulfarculaceae bacterium]